MGNVIAHAMVALLIGALDLVSLSAAAEPLRGQAREDKGHMCAFCHRVADSYAQAAYPEWQPSLGGVPAYSLFPVGDPSTASDNEVSGSRSVVCLACHDTDDTRGMGTFRYGHPFGMPYRGALQGGPDALSVTGAPYYLWSAERMSVLSPRDFKPAQRGDDGSSWQVVAPGAGVALPLFRRADAASIGSPFVECETCHDPHSSKPAFIRVAGSRLCLACHNI